MNDLRISTMTAISKLSSDINLKKLYDNININNTIHFIEYRDNPTKGFSKKSLRKKRKKVEKKVFYNQVTLHLFYEKLINIKVFNNGKVQMTGLKYEEQGKEVINLLIDELIKCNNENTIFEGDKLDLLEYRIVLINSDFDIKYKVNRELLHREIIRLGLCSSYEPTIYPGVNMKYYYNDAFNNLGVCKCSGRCNGKGSAYGDNECKRVTIAIFNSGKIIITGGKHLKQLDTCYKFISNILNDKKKYISK